METGAGSNFATPAKMMHCLFFCLYGPSKCKYAKAGPYLRASKSCPKALTTSACSFDSNMLDSIAAGPYIQGSEKQLNSGSCSPPPPTPYHTQRGSDLSLQEVCCTSEHICR